MKQLPRDNSLMNNANGEVINTFEEIEVPSVSISGYEFVKEIGEWLENIITREKIGDAEVLVMMQLRDFMKEKSRRIQIRDICYTFGLVLLDMGIDKDEVVSLKDFNKDDYSFKCHLKRQGKILECAIRLGDVVDLLPELTVKYEYGERRYEYYPAGVSKPLSLQLVSYTLYNPDLGSKLYSYMSPFNLIYKLENKDNSLTINFSKNGDMSLDTYDSLMYLKSGSIELSKYLLCLTFPISLDEIYRKMLEVIPSIISSCRNLEIVSQKTIDEDKKEISDELRIIDDKLKKFVMTKKGIKVGIDEEGNTCYQDNIVYVNKNKDGSIEYGLKVMSVRELKNIKPIIETINMATGEIENIRALVKTLLNKNI